MTSLKTSFLLFIVMLNSLVLYSQKNRVKDSLADIVYAKGNSFFKLRQYDSVSFYARKSLNVYKSTNNYKGISKAYLCLSSVYTYFKNNDSAYYYLLKAKRNIEFVEDKAVKAGIYLNIAHLNFQNDDYDSCLNNMQLAVDLLKPLEEKKSNLAAAYNNLGIVHNALENYEKAINYYLKSIEIKTQINDSIGISKSYHWIGRLKEKINERESALYYYNIVLEIQNKINFKNHEVYITLGAFYAKEGEFNLSNSYYDKALSIIKEKNLDFELFDVYEAFFNNYFKLKNYKKAMEFKKKCDEILKENNKAQNLEQIEALKSQLVLFQKERELEKEKMVNEKDRAFFLVVIIFLVIILIFLLQSKRTHQLKRKKDHLLLESKILRAQMNPHFIFNALGAIHNSLMNDNPLQTSVYLSRFSKLMRQNFEFVNKDHIKLSEDINALTNYIETLLLRFNNTFDYVINVSSTIDADKVLLPPLLIQPFVENSIEHGFKNKKTNGHLQIDIVKEKRFLKISVSDNGVGFNTKVKATKEHSFSVTKKRLRLLSKTAGKSLQVNSSNKGTQVSFKVNIILKP